MMVKRKAPIMVCKIAGVDSSHSKNCLVTMMAEGEFKWASWQARGRLQVVIATAITMAAGAGCCVSGPLPAMRQSGMMRLRRPRLTLHLRGGAVPAEAGEGAGVRGLELQTSDLRTAAARGAIYDIEGLLAAGAVVDELDSSGQSALHMAVDAGRLGAAALLVAKGADVDVADCSERTPLHHAAARGLKGAALVLLDLGASLRATDERGWTPLHEAAAAKQVCHA